MADSAPTDPDEDTNPDGRDDPPLPPEARGVNTEEGKDDSDDEEEEDDEETAPDPSWYPSTELYARDPKYQIIDLNFKARDIGVGIVYNTKRTYKTVLAPGGHICRFNEPKNEYGLKVFCSGFGVVIDEALANDANRADEARGAADFKIKEKEPFMLVLKAESAKLMEHMNFNVEELKSRRVKLMWKVWCGFNSSHDCNLMLKELAKYYAMLRIGIKVCQGDELAAAAQAIKMLYKHHLGGDACDECNWAMPIILAFNFHLEHHTNFNKICFSDKLDVDKELAAGIRKDNSKVAWITHKVGDEPVQGVVESNASMRLKMFTFINNNLNLNSQKGDAKESKYKRPRITDLKAGEARTLKRGHDDDPDPSKRTRLSLGNTTFP